MKIDLNRLLSRVPDYREFYTVEEMDARTAALAEKYPENVQLMEVGKTKEGRPIRCLKIGHGSQNALLYGTPHPNEPIGTMMLDALSQILASDPELCAEFDYTWYIIKSCDVDGMKKNEGWFKGPFTVSNYQRNFFRPAFDQQVEWSFPVDYKTYSFHNPTPETQCLMRLVDELHPEFIYSLHNCGFGGVYWYMSDGDEELFRSLHDTPARYGIALNLGEAEMPYCKNYYEAIYQMVGLKENYDYMEEFMPNKPTASLLSGGACCVEYANREEKRSRIIVTEMPYYLDPRVADMSLTDIPRRQLVLESVDLAERDFNIWCPVFRQVEKYMAPDNQFYLAAKERTASGNTFAAKRKWAETQIPADVMAKVCELFDNRYSTRFYSNLQLILVRRACETELAKEGLSEEARAALTAARDTMREKADENLAVLEQELNYTAIPIADLVKVQMECGLLYAQYVHDKNA